MPHENRDESFLGNQDHTCWIRTNLYRIWPPVGEHGVRVIDGEREREGRIGPGVLNRIPLLRAVGLEMGGNFKTDRIVQVKDHKNGVFGIGGESGKVAVSVMSVVRSVSVPLGITTPGQPNIASTIWRTVSDSQSLVYFYDSATVPNAFWVELSKLDFSPKAGTKRLELTDGTYYSGETSKHFEVAEPFTPLAATVAAKK